ncbi:MAG TPA: DNA-binding protein [Pseudonocardiaceae bacterium]|nr:DNA-binding protein [Pseudonocardiaceae bacterium]
METHTPTLDEIRSWPPTVSVPTACAPLGISRSHGYDLARRGQFPARVITVGGCYRVITASLIRVLDGEGGAA